MSSGHMPARSTALALCTPRSEHRAWCACAQCQTLPISLDVVSASLLAKLATKPACEARGVARAVSIAPRIAATLHTQQVAPSTGPSCRY